MGVHNKQRRAAKRRKRTRRSPTAPSGRPSGSRAGWSADRPDEPFADPPVRGAPAQEPRDEELHAEHLVLAAVADVRRNPKSARRHAQALLSADVSAPLVASTADQLLHAGLAAAVRSGWGPADLGEISRRRAPDTDLSALAALLTEECGRHPASSVHPAWRSQIAELGPPVRPRLDTATGLHGALALAAVLTGLPVIEELLPAPGSAYLAAASPTTDAGARALQRVRALLAKAESTDFDEEAEALSAKAQELISRYALDRLVDRTDDASASVGARRFWIDAPYVVPKAMLLNAVARANRCRTVLLEQLGFSTLVGEPADLDAVELLTTSLLLQADRAMLRHGQHVDGLGRSRTRSFRQSFLVSYAGRIGERLTEVDRSVLDESPRAGGLLPVLRRQAEHVEAEFVRMFPHLVTRATSVSNRLGWAAGRAAADLAELDANLALTGADG